MQSPRWNMNLRNLHFKWFVLGKMRHVVTTSHCGKNVSHLFEVSLLVALGGPHYRQTRIWPFEPLMTFQILPLLPKGQVPWPLLWLPSNILARTWQHFATCTRTDFHFVFCAGIMIQMRVLNKCCYVEQRCNRIRILVSLSSGTFRDLFSEPAWHQLQSITRTL